MAKPQPGKISRFKPQTDTTVTRFASPQEMWIQNWDEKCGYQQHLGETEKRYQMGQQAVPIVPPC